MIINGFQKLTLLDFPEKVACIIFTAGCNFRCPFCHNASLVTHIDKDQKIEEREIFSYLEKRKGLLDGVCITGGEPLIQEDIKEFIEKIKNLGYAVKLDTNGSNPKKLKELIDKKLVDYVAMDIKNSKSKYACTAGVQNISFDNIEKSISILLENKVDYEFRTTVVNELHTVEDIQDIAKLIQGAEKYFIQNFKDSGDIIAQNVTPVTEKKLADMQKTALDSGLSAKIR